MRAVRFPVAALVIALAAWLVYRPALNRVFAMDQVWYFAELHGRTSLADGLHFVDYAATRTYWKGDDALFRPLLFVWLAVGNRLFMYHHTAWNIASLVLHVIVAIGLYALLMTIRPSRLALPVSVLFAVLKPPLDLVTWNHLGGYLIGCACLALGCRAFVRLSQAGAAAPEDPASSRRRDLVVFALAFTAAGFCHEAMVIAGVLAATILLVVFHQRGTRSWSTAAALYLPALLFAAAYATHVTRVARFSYVDRPDVSGIFDAGNLPAVVPRSLGALAAWTRELALPTALTFTPAPFERLTKQFALSWTEPVQLLNLALTVPLVLMLVRASSRSQIRRQAPFLILSGLSLLAYAAIICLGRPQREVLDIGYYLYPFSLLLLPLAYACIDFDRPLGLIQSVSLGGWLAMFIMLHGVATHADAQAIHRANDAASRYLEQISRDVDAHGLEPGFTLHLPPHTPAVDPEITLRAGYPDDPSATVRTATMTKVLFAKYYK